MAIAVPTALSRARRAKFTVTTELTKGVFFEGQHFTLSVVGRRSTRSRNSRRGCSCGSELSEVSHGGLGETGWWYKMVEGRERLMGIKRTRAVLKNRLKLRTRACMFPEERAGRRWNQLRLGVNKNIKKTLAFDVRIKPQGFVQGMP